MPVQVRQVHSEGGYGSSGYRYPWCEEEAYKNLLRTHTTAVSARMLHKLAQVRRRGVRVVVYCWSCCVVGRVLVVL